MRPTAQQRERAAAAELDTVILRYGNARSNGDKFEWSREASAEAYAETIRLTRAYARAIRRTEREKK